MKGPSKPRKPKKRKQYREESESDQEEPADQEQPRPPRPSGGNRDAERLENASLRTQLAEALQRAKAANNAAVTSAKNEQAAKDLAAQASATAAAAAAGAITPPSSSTTPDAAGYGVFGPMIDSTPKNIGGMTSVLTTSGIMPGMPWHAQQLVARIEASYQSELASHRIEASYQLGARARSSAMQDYMITQYMMSTRDM